MEKLTECRICKSKKLRVFLDLGNQPLANSFINKKNLDKKENKYPLQVAFCEDCNLCQLTHVVSPEILFRDYVYFSSKMPRLSDHFREYAEEVVEEYVSKKDDLIVEIGSNDGILLSAVKALGPRVLGVDPALNIAKVANERGVETLPEFFTSGLASNISKKYGKARVLIGNNVVAHINDYNDLVRGAYRLLEDDGVFVFEAPYLVDMFENLTFDTIYHEHLSYLAVRPLVKLFGEYNMEIINVKLFPVQGISLRVYVAKKGARSVFKSVKEFIKKEKDMGLDSFSSYLRLARRVGELKENVTDLSRKLKSEGKKIAAYGAPAKGNTLLNYFGIGAETLDFATEELPSKVGLLTPGGHVPVVHVDEARANPPDYYLLLAWNYKDAILKKEEEYIKRGGKFIVPVGKVEII